MMNLKELKEYLQKPYESAESFLSNVIFPVFGEENFEDAGRLNMLKSMPELKAKAEASGIISILNLGGIYVEGSQLDIFDITINSKRQLARSRVDIQEIVRRIISNFSGAFMIFHYKTMEGHWDWRFTFCRKGANKVDTTDAKRYTFMLGPGQSCRTAAENFLSLHNKIEKQGEFDIEDIVAAFDVEALSKEFFKKYKEHYERFCTFVFEHRSDTEWFGPEFCDWEDKIVRDYVKKLLGRIVFLHFLQKKGWMGVPADGEWGDGDTDFMRNLFIHASEDQKNNYLDQVLEPLFADALDTDRSENSDLFDTGVETFRNVKIPYLNGGLFERDVLDDPKSRFPQQLFADLFEFFYEYNFTIDENDPNDAQVGVDPEMLGMIFENLLEDNKDKGAFYTPKEIVQYMCKESLIAYLQTDVEDDETKEAIRKFVTTYDVEALGGKESDLAGDIGQLLLDVKICDPAIGSGAFPMGLLKELFFCRGALEDFRNASSIKKHIIQHNIYGVDIERGAVDIARLRFWLSFIVDEETPHALPNMDFKIMQGNSLLEQYKGVPLDDIFDSSRQMMLAFDEETTARMLLKEHMFSYFDKEDHTEKARILESIDNAVKSLVKAKTLGNPEVCAAIDALDLRNNQEFFLWHTWFNEVLADKKDAKGKTIKGSGGFDIVIGNPPYIQLQNDGGLLGNLYKPLKFETFAQTGDIYSLFYEHGVNLLKEDGVLCYITSNKWMRAAYGEKTRQFFAKKTNPMLLIDFAAMKIFENATVETNILLLSNSKNQKATKCVIGKNSETDVLSHLNGYVHENTTELSFINGDKWIIMSGLEASIAQKINKKGVALKDWDINIFRGVLTGFNDAFIIDSETRSKILNSCRNEDEYKRTLDLLCPVIRGRDVQKYISQWANIWLIATFPTRNYNIDLYPSVADFILSFGMERVEQSGAKRIIDGIKVNARKKTKHKWFETQDPIAYWQQLIEPKLIWKRIGSILRFAYDKEGSCVLDSTCFATGEHIEYLCCILNSKMGHYLLKDSPKTGTGDLLISVQAIEPIKVPKPDKQTDEQFKALLQKMIESPSSTLEHEIDLLVYDLYGLTTEEIAIVEGTNN